MIPQTPVYLDSCLLLSNIESREDGLSYKPSLSLFLSLLFPRVTVYGGARKSSTDIGFFKQDKVQRREGTIVT